MTDTDKGEREAFETVFTDAADWRFDSSPRGLDYRAPYALLWEGFQAGRASLASAAPARLTDEQIDRVIEKFYGGVECDDSGYTAARAFAIAVMDAIEAASAKADAVVTADPDAAMFAKLTTEWDKAAQFPAPTEGPTP